MINCEDLYEFIQNQVQTQPTIIYFGIGTMFYRYINQKYNDG